LMLSPDESLNESHRHHAHAMAIYPLDLLNYHSGGRDKQIIDETINNLELLGTGLWVGFSFPWMAEFYSRQCNGEGAAYQLKLFWEVFCSQNGFNLNGDFNKYGITQWHYRPFTLEANMCAADALQEMLLQTYDGIIRVFPAIPESWRKNGASFSSFRGMKGILISSSIKNGEVEFIHLVAQNDGNYLIQNDFNSDKIIIKRRNCLEEINCHCKDNFTIELLKDEICHITAKK
ncbi:glycosyl hydrolase family 95 catalytic domain-containing protein, partial [Vallitalea guaymasensis]|uniref:glycosyl hydrolase family 95 catalytic domain-containing protein n=1 Tax=Vallitalea guaymasensis TaxID=1185412 RepID=UPI002729FB1D